ncbi:hypothetical protein CesoFtcFv8_025049 [Champsocephalus esox]|uniref:Uncharacterized protein n=1 Tax=Champsocephalus esox TaxID=159716 RepID=A0AAN8GGC4_9TELE|nr:hypothetical protein CesoFtcFv8_025049 [Champsocephalus esox]
MASPEPLGSSRVGGSLYLRLRLLRSCCSSNPDDFHKVPPIPITARGFPPHRLLVSPGVHGLFPPTQSRD